MILKRIFAAVTDPERGIKVDVGVEYDSLILGLKSQSYNEH
jgi:hypothetical protein